MHIEAELVDWLDRNMPDGRQNKPRNKKIVLTYYGFDQLLWPTLEQVAERFQLGSRQSVQQLIKACFRDLVTLSDLPTVRRICEAIAAKDFISVEELCQEFRNDGLIGGTTNLFGILNLASDFGVCKSHGVYDADLNVVTRAASALDGPTYLMQADTFNTLKVHLKVAQKLPGSLGVAKFAYLTAELGVDSSRIIQLIRSTPKACVIDDGEDEWYVFDHRENTLANSCGKVFTLTERCDIRVLSDVLANSLRRRPSRYPYPDESVIRKWIEQSGKFQVEGSTVTFSGPRIDLTPTESATVEYLAQHRGSGYRAVKDHLLSLDVGKPTAHKAIAESPVVYVDKSAGPGAYVYRPVSQMTPAPHPANEGDIRYESFRNRLKGLLDDGDTDADIETIARREQSLLRDWLFADQPTGVCAICGETFSTGALVAAHKKKRAFCTEAERVDPYIVFPVCTFGCDYLYEREIVRVVNGEVRMGKLPDERTADCTRAVAVAGRRVPEASLHGPQRYFRRDLTAWERTSGATG